MKSFFSPLSIFVILFIVLSGCSKDKRIENRLSSGSGKWNIELYTESSYTNNTLDYSDSYANAGNMVFDDNGTLIWTFILDGFTDVYGGSWSNSKDDITIIVDGEGLVFKIKEYSRKEIELEYTDEYTFNGTTNKDVLFMKLVKDK